MSYFRLSRLLIHTTLLLYYRLMTELADVEDYREAYQTIAEEMRGLVARNALAEDEATRLSEFNAEILSHRNPTQKILYVDRIRRELADTKQVSSYLYDTKRKVQFLTNHFLLSLLSFSLLPLIHTHFYLDLGYSPIFFLLLLG